MMQSKKQLKELLAGKEIVLEERLAQIQGMEQLYQELDSQRIEEVDELLRQYNELFQKYKETLEELAQKDLEINRINPLGVEQAFPLGHFYSPIASYEEIKGQEKRLYKHLGQKDIPAVNMNYAGQLEKLTDFETYYTELQFPKEKTQGKRYYYENDFYSYGDAISLYSMIRYAKPKRIIEVGSGFTSSLILDTNDSFFASAIECCFIEPYPDRLYELMREEDKANTEVLVEKVQDVPLERFEKLEANDILLVDSSHVAKAGSDLNYLLFEVMPALQKGVYIHFHDVFYPFELPPHWLEKGFSWNENYFLHAFLQYNEAFTIVWWLNYLAGINPSSLFAALPLAQKKIGASIWLQKQV